MQILICESEPMIQDLIHEYLTPLGFKVLVPENEVKCRDFFAAKIPNVIVLDTHMRGTSVTQAVIKIREFDQNVPILLLGSNYGITSLEDAVDLGANAFIEKPFRMKEFLEQILKLIPNH